MGEIKTGWLIFIAIVLAVIAGLLLMISSIGARHQAAISNFDECAAAGNPIMETYPEQCRANGQTFTNPHQMAPVAPTVPTATPDCVPAGCSKEVCVEAAKASQTVTSCVYLAQFACYKNARCERQADGACGWTQTAELQSCIKASPMPLIHPMTN